MLFRAFGAVNLTVHCIRAALDAPPLLLVPPVKVHGVVPGFGFRPVIPAKDTGLAASIQARFSTMTVHAQTSTKCARERSPQQQKVPTLM